MAPMKRKVGVNATSDLPATKRPRVDPKSKSKTPSKRKHIDKENANTPKPLKPDARPQPASILRTEQPAFPRGGAGVLTLLEKKQIQAKATRDAFAEHKREKDLFGSFSKPSAEDSAEEDLSSEQAELPETPKKVTRPKQKRRTTSAIHHESETRIESLTFKRLTEGSLVLGRVSRINPRNLIIALPNNLTGTVPLTAISAALTQKIEAVLATESNDSNDDEDDDEIQLHDYFTVGQWLRVCVSSVSDDDGTLGKAHGKKAIELSIDPWLTNVGLEPSNIVAGCTIQVSVSSVEDHGIAVDLGLKRGKATGFVPKKELDDFPEWSNVKIGAVILCLVTEITSNGRIIKLSASRSRIGDTKTSTLKMAPTIESFLPGTAVEVLITEVGRTGLLGKIMGLLDVTADLLHSGAYNADKDFPSRYAIGKKVKGRLLYRCAVSDANKMGFSVLNEVVTMQGNKTHSENQKLYHISEIVSEAQVTGVEARLGLYLKLAPGAQGFAHISRLSDDKVESISDISGAYKIGTVHRARILDYNSVDNLYLVSLQPKVLAQPFLQLEDVPIGVKVTGKVAKLLVTGTGITGLLVTLADGITGLVSQMHLSDIILQHPEKKFREGMNVVARVLSKDIVKHRLRLTLKRTLVNSDQKIWKEFSDVVVGESSPGTLVKVETYGAIIQFYGSVKGFLPVSEMSEAYIKDATQHFRVGQSLTVNAMSVTPETGRLTVSCREPTNANPSIESTLASLSLGILVSGKVFEKSEDDLLLRLHETGLIARLSLDHVSDGSVKKRKSAISKIRVGQDLQDLLVFEVRARQRMVVVSNRSSLIRAAKDGSLLRTFSDLKEGMTVTGLVSSVTDDGIFVLFAGGISGLIPQTQVSAESAGIPDYGVVLLQPIAAKILSIDYRGATPRFWLTMRETADVPPVSVHTKNAESGVLMNPVDETLKSVTDLVVGKITRAKIISVKETQVNVELAKGIQGRIDVSAIFDEWNEIKDRKKPLQTFSAKQILTVKVLGAHDTRNHKFLPLTHRTGKSPVLELSAKPSDVRNMDDGHLTLENVEPGSSWLAFVNNIGDDCLWVNISPNVRGRIRAVDVSDDLSLAADLESNFPIGSALRVRVVSVDVDKNRLDLSAKQGDLTAQLTLNDVVKGTIIPGRITKVSDRQILIQISESVVGAVDLIDMADDYAEVDPSKYQKNDLIRAYVIHVDIPNKKLSLSLRPSKVLSSSLKVTDLDVTSVQQLQVNDVVRGFISNVADSGLFVTLGHNITAHIRVSNLSDSFLKEWKDQFQRDQLVQGKIISIDKITGHIQMSLKQSVLDVNYKPRLTFTDMHVDDIVTGKVAKVETFGVFILVDNSENVRGLCHRSEIAEKRIEDASKLFAEGDVVKAKVLKVELDKRRINFGMKASYFGDDDNQDRPSDSEDEMDSDSEGGAAFDNDSESEPEIEGVNTDDSDFEMADEADDSEKSEEEGVNDNGALTAPSALNVGAFDWDGVSNQANATSEQTVDGVATDAALSKAKTKNKKPQIKIDRTVEFSAEPQSAVEYERLIERDPSSSRLWLDYVAHYLTSGDVDAARSIGDRALSTINIENEAERLEVWSVLLNLENVHGDNESLQSTFERACQVNDAQTIHERLSSIYIQSGKYEKADDLFQSMLKQFGSTGPKLWINYATFCFDSLEDAEKGRSLLSRALQRLPQFTHFDVTSKFAQLEFKSPHGLPERGRTIFEGLISSFPKRIDLFNVLLDLELKQGDKSQVRPLFERIFSGKVKAKQAHFFFKRWMEFEMTEGDQKSINAVKLKADDWVKKNTLKAA